MTSEDHDKAWADAAGLLAAVSPNLGRGWLLQSVDFASHPDDLPRLVAEFICPVVPRDIPTSALPVTPSPGKYSATVVAREDGTQTIEIGPQLAPEDAP